MARKVGTLMVVLCVCTATAAEAKKKGTHFIAEASGGALFGTGFAEGGEGYALRTAMGLGGKFRGFPLRFYGIAVVRYGALTTTHEQGTQTADLRRGLLDVSAGLRIMLPIRRLRILGEVTLGSSFVSSTTVLNGGLEEYEADDARFATYLATGLQYRLHRNLSIGALVEWSLPSEREEFDVVGALSGVSDEGSLHGWTSLTATLVAHF